MRLFVGLDLPWSLRQRLSLLVTGVPGAKWAPVENYHLTLRFIGEAPRHVAEEIDGALLGLSGRGFALAMAGVGLFEKGGRPSALWAGVARNGALDHLQGKIETALQRIGLPPERRRFLPHVTLARLDNAADARVAAFLQANSLFRAEPIQIEHFVLFSSQRGKDASVYTREAEYELESNATA